MSTLSLLELDTLLWTTAISRDALAEQIRSLDLSRELAGEEAVECCWMIGRLEIPVVDLLDRVVQSAMTEMVPRWRRLGETALIARNAIEPIPLTELRAFKTTWTQAFQVCWMASPERTPGLLAEWAEELPLACPSHLVIHEAFRRYQAGQLEAESFASEMAALSHRIKRLGRSGWGAASDFYEACSTWMSRPELRDASRRAVSRPSNRRAGLVESVHTMGWRAALGVPELMESVAGMPNIDSLFHDIEGGDIEACLRLIGAPSTGRDLRAHLITSVRQLADQELIDWVGASEGLQLHLGIRALSTFPEPRRSALLRAGVEKVKLAQGDTWAKPTLSVALRLLHSPPAVWPPVSPMRAQDFDPRQSDPLSSVVM